MEPVVEELVQSAITVFPNTPLGVCARTLMNYGFRHLPVIDDDGRPLGVIEDLDVFKHGALLGPKLELWLAYRASSDRLQAAQVMKPFGASCLPGTSIWLALHRMAAAGGQALAVNDSDGRLVGVLTEHDAVQIAADLVPERMIVGDVMTADVVKMDWLRPAHEALTNAVTQGIRHVVVTQGDLLHGVVSLRDLIAENVSDRRDLAVDDVIGPKPVVSTLKGASLASAASEMVRMKVGCLPVLSDNGEVVGIVTRTDLLHAVLAEVESRAFRAETSRTGSDSS